ncbi:hypothetical protein BCR44DRAFT_61162 [Catenaria anguillulae PL171]|uniref:RING-type domain-containing protein n=1 Tax=Catenaria anguillulae PL171 TaxID=765915 RepID=A0A1Y2HH22_9FUNG|nr:hypothetical protein BCR44DRAFT_61162 [Catenaria anguillulae PL171]
MPRHSKNNTASAVFTYAERERLTYGTQRQRLGTDSKRAFDACFLCLQTAAVPMSCPEGHVACKECVYESILAQKKEIKRALKLIEEEKRKEQAKEQEMTEAAARDNLAKAEASVSVTGAASTAGRSDSKGGKPALNSFWIPSLAPQTVKQIEVPKDEPKIMCLCDKPHTLLSAKKLFPLHFKRPSPSSSTSTIAPKSNVTCYSCSKHLNNGSSIRALKPCGHVLCAACVKDFVVSSKRCNVCDTKVRPDRGDVVTIATEGTGFSSTGKVEATKYDHGFL